MTLRAADGATVASATEEECCAALGFPCRPPEERERFWEWIDPFLDGMEEAPDPVISLRRS